MRILVDLIHPAHVHFFRNAIAIWRDRGHEVVLTARDKDITYELLRLYDLPFVAMGKARGGALANGLELISRCFRFWRLCRSFRPHVMLGLAGPGMAHVGWAKGIPSLVFTDTENARLSNRITFPFASRILTPACFGAPVPEHKHTAQQPIPLEVNA